MVQKALSVIQEHEETKKVHLISGGAAWADHVAVNLYLLHEFKSLTLHLPAYILESNRFSGKFKTPGGTSNYYHEIFCNQCLKGNFRGKPLPTIKQMFEARDKGATIKVNMGGFWDRNTDIAADAKDLLIAFTWGEGKAPTDGGTADTWRKSSAKEKIHVPLKSILS